MALRGNDVGNGPWHRIVCQNEAIFGTCVGPRMGSKTPDMSNFSGKIFRILEDFLAVRAGVRKTLQKS